MSGQIVNAISLSLRVAIASGRASDSISQSNNVRDTNVFIVSSVIHCIELLAYMRPNNTIQ